MMPPTRCSSVAEKRGPRGDGDDGPIDTPEVLLERLGFPRKRQFQKARFEWLPRAQAQGLGALADLSN